MNVRHWQLPKGVDEVLPPQAASLEQRRRDVLDVFAAWGYELVIPPLIEFLDSLLVGAGSDLDLQTFKVVDQQSGRLLGVRADMTSQAARIDAHSLQSDATRRLCYAGTVVHANPAGVLESRVPMLAGAELFGETDLEADAEVLSLMSAVLDVCGLPEPVFGLGHAGVFRGVVADLELGPDAERTVFDAVQRKSQSDIVELIGELGVGEPHATWLLELPGLLGGAEVFDVARRALDGVGAAVSNALNELELLAAKLSERVPAVDVHFDLAELSGYGYHTGVVFAGYAPGQGTAVARGGRYDDVGSAFGRARPATGFDVNLKRLPVAAAAPESAIFAPAAASLSGAARASLWQRIAELRGAGNRVVQGLTERDAMSGCDRLLTFEHSTWVVKPVDEGT